MPYEPGELVAVGLGRTVGKEVERWSLKTAGAAAQIRLTPDRETLRADGQDLSFVRVEIVDAAREFMSEYSGQYGEVFADWSGANHRNWQWQSAQHRELFSKRNIRRLKGAPW